MRWPLARTARIKSTKINASRVSFARAPRSAVPVARIASASARELTVRGPRAVASNARSTRASVVLDARTRSTARETTASARAVPREVDIAPRGVASRAAVTTVAEHHFSPRGRRLSDARMSADAPASPSASPAILVDACQIEATIARLAHEPTLGHSYAVAHAKSRAKDFLEEARALRATREGPCARAKADAMFAREAIEGVARADVRACRRRCERLIARVDRLARDVRGTACPNDT